MPDYQIAQERMLFNADKTTLVPEGHKDGKFLYAGIGTRLPASACKKFGIVDGKLKGAKSGSKKPKDSSENKGGGSPSNKDGGGSETKPATIGDIKGVGPASVKALDGAGIKDFAALAAIDPDAPPEVKGLAAGFKWADVVASAKALVSAQGDGA